MIHETYAIIHLVCGAIILAVALNTISRILNGSKTGFSLTLMAFTLGYALQFAALFFIYTFTVIVDGNEMYNFYAFNICLYFYWFLSIQAWIFGIKYIESAINNSIKPFLTQKQINFILWAGIAIYVAGLVFSAFTLFSDFPGYDSADFTDWRNSTFLKIWAVTQKFWFFFNLLSTCIALLAIYKLFSTVKKL
jgi:hypothetical protein